MHIDRNTVMIKPVGAACNLRCSYCYYLPTAETCGSGRMSHKTLESLLEQMLGGAGDEVTIAWQGGEPTLAGLAFFEKAVELQRKHVRPGQRVANALQTNGTLLDEAWCRFLHKHQFLVGLSWDGPPQFHDCHRRDAQGRPTSDAVERAMRLLLKHRVEFNILCVLTRRNIKDPEQLLNFLLNREQRWLQFIPAIEWETGDDGQPRLQPFCVDPQDYGRFLCRLFDLWFDRYRDRVSVRIFDAVLGRLFDGRMSYCILGEGCHNQLTIEHDGGVFACDHFVEPRWRLGEAAEPSPDGKPWMDRVDTDRLDAFGRRKGDLPDDCRRCEYVGFCHGGCPKHRPHRGDLPEPTVLCAGYRMFFAHSLTRMRWLARYLCQGTLPPPPGHPESRTAPPSPTVDRGPNTGRRRR